jgi:uncharacterized delta-60 repeat protein
MSRGGRRVVCWVVGLACVTGASDAMAADRLVVRFAPGTGAESRLDARRDAGASLVRVARELAGTQIVHVRDGEAGTALKSLRAEPDVLWAERDVRIRASARVPSDPRYPEQWGLPAIGAPSAWDVTVGSADVTVAVLDTGVSPSHADLRPNLWSNAAEEGGSPGRDDDGNGLVDDRRGWDWVSWDADPADLNGHGTHVAGIAAGRGDDAIGAAGVAWRARVMPVRVLDADGLGWASNLAQGIAYAARMGARVANLSLGGGYSRAVDDAVAAHPELLVVAAAGNAGADLDAGGEEYPCELPYEHVVCVAATDPDDRLAPFSNHGVASVDLGAPGVRILSASPHRRAVLSDGFEAGAGQWPEIVDWSPGPVPGGGGQGLGAAVPAGPASGEAWARTDGLDTRGLWGCRGRLVAWVRSPSSLAGLTIETLDDAGMELAEHATVTGPLAPWGSTLRFALPTLDDRPGTRFGLSAWKTMPDAQVEAAVDDVAIDCVDPAAEAGDRQEHSDGTSMAAPFVSGAAALAWSAEPEASALSVRRALLDTAEPAADLAGRTATGGILDAAAAVRAVRVGDAPEVPPPPSLPQLPVAAGWWPGTLDPAWGSDGLSTFWFTEFLDALESAPVSGGARLVAARDPDEFLLMRLRPDGSADPGFGTGGRVAVAVPAAGGGLPAHPLDAFILPDGRTVLVAAGGDEIVVMRRRADGSADPSFGSGGTVRLPTFVGGRVLPVDVVVDAHGRILFPEWRRTGTLEQRHFQVGVVRLLADGRLDPSFGDGGTAWHDLGGPFDGRELELDAGGGVLLLGTAEGQTGILRLKADGSRDASFGREGVAWLPFPGGLPFLGMAVGPDERITVASLGWADGTIIPELMLTRFLADGRPDRHFGYAGMAQTQLRHVRPFAAEVLADGRTAVAAYNPEDPVGGIGFHAGAVLRFERGGRFDEGWGSGGVAPCAGARFRDLSVEPDGDVVAAAEFNESIVVARLRGGRAAGGSPASSPCQVETESPEPEPSPEPTPPPEPTPSPEPEPSPSPEPEPSPSPEPEPSPSPRPADPQAPPAAPPPPGSTPSGTTPGPPSGGPRRSAGVERPAHRRRLRLLGTLRGRRLTVRLVAQAPFRGRLLVRRAGSRRIAAASPVRLAAGRPRTIRIRLRRAWPAVDIRVRDADGLRAARRIVRARTAIHGSGRPTDHHSAD